jgi:hypothetical protein
MSIILVEKKMFWEKSDWIWLTFSGENWWGQAPTSPYLPAALVLVLN